MRGAMAARWTVSEALDRLFEEIDHDITLDLYTEGEASEALRELDGVIEDAWNDWKGGEDE